MKYDWAIELPLEEAFLKLEGLRFERDGMLEEVGGDPGRIKFKNLRRFYRVVSEVHDSEAIIIARLEATLIESSCGSKDTSSCEKRRGL